MFILEQRGQYTVLSMNEDNSLVILFSQNVPIAFRVGDGTSENHAIIFKSKDLNRIRSRHLDNLIKRFQMEAMLVPQFEPAFLDSLEKHTIRLMRCK